MLRCTAISTKPSRAAVCPLARAIKHAAGRRDFPAATAASRALCLCVAAADTEGGPTAGEISDSISVALYSLFAVSRCGALSPAVSPVDSGGVGAPPPSSPDPPTVEATAAVVLLVGALSRLAGGGASLDSPVSCIVRGAAALDAVAYGAAVRAVVEEELAARTTLQAAEAAARAVDIRTPFSVGKKAASRCLKEKRAVATDESAARAVVEARAAHEPSPATVYLAACEAVDAPPISTILRWRPGHSLDLRRVALGPRGVAALLMFLRHGWGAPAAKDAAGLRAPRKLVLAGQGLSNTEVADLVMVLPRGVVSLDLSRNPAVSAATGHMLLAVAAGVRTAPTLRRVNLSRTAVPKGLAGAVSAALSERAVRVAHPGSGKAYRIAPFICGAAPFMDAVSLAAAALVCTAWRTALLRAVASAMVGPEEDGHEMDMGELDDAAALDPLGEGSDASDDLVVSLPGVDEPDGAKPKKAH